MADPILGTDFHEELFGTDGDDTIISLSGYDTLDGGDGSDTYIVNAADFNGRYIDIFNDTGTTGVDTILAAEAGITIGILSLNGIEVIDGIANSVISGENENQYWDFTNVELNGISLIFGHGGHDEIIGSTQDDKIDGGEGHDVLDGGEGDDKIYGSEGHDVIDGGIGDDTLLGGEGNDILYGGAGNDRLYGGTGYDIMDGGEGSDTYLFRAEDFQDQYIDLYNDTGLSGVDTILAADAGIRIGLGTNFSLVSSGIEVIDGVDGSSIVGDTDHQRWDFTGVELTGIDVIEGRGGQDHIRGTEFDDVIDGGFNRDTLMGGLGEDTLIGNQGNDTLLGEGGNDTLIGSHGYDYLDGGEGSDSYLVGLRNEGYVDTYEDTGLSGTDSILATEAGTVIGLASGFSAASGIEVISANGFDDVTIGGTNDAEVWNFTGVKIDIASNDYINSGGGHDQVTGNASANRIRTGEGHDTIYGEDGNDYLWGEEGHDTIYGGNGVDVLDGASGNDFLDGGENADFYVFYQDSEGWTDIIQDTGTTGTDRMVAMEDDVLISLADGFNNVSSGIELISANGFSNVWIGGSDQAEHWDFTGIRIENIARIDAGEGMDVVRGSSFADELIGGGGHDRLYGDRGSDTLYGGEDSDWLYGENGQDQLFGENGHDILEGGASRDILDGGAGHDILDGGTGRDVLTGGEGFDIFVFDQNSNDDTLTDFNVADDRIDLTAYNGLEFDDLNIIDRSWGVQIDLGATDILIQNVSADMITADLFLF